MGSDTLDLILVIVGALLGLALLVAFVRYVAFPLMKLLVGFLKRLFALLGRTIVDFGKLVGSMILSVVYALLAILCVIFLQVSAAGRFSRAMRAEAARGALAVYRLLIGNPLRFIGLGGMVEGLEERLPQVVSGALDDTVGPRAAMFEGYRIIGTLPTGGSGAKLYIAEPSHKKLKELQAEGFQGGKVVIKSFTPDDEGALAGIVRESQGLQAGHKLGLILEHGLSAARFFYVMRYVPGEHLRAATAKLHEHAPDGLDAAGVRRVLGYMDDLLGTLGDYHRGGLWHKDVKPDNVIVEPDPKGQGTARLVDFGLMSSLQSTMTLTTHGTEYYRDPEMVRRALKGAKVQEIDGEKFDVYGAGAVFFSMIENSFPAQGVLTPMTKKHPPAAAWIIRRAMAEYDQRYANTDAMLSDVRALLAVPDPFAFKPFNLPSMNPLAESDPLREGPVRGGTSGVSET